MERQWVFGPRLSVCVYVCFGKLRRIEILMLFFRLLFTDFDVFHVKSQVSIGFYMQLGNIGNR